MMRFKSVRRGRMGKVGFSFFLFFWGGGGEFVVGTGADFTDGCIVRDEGMELGDTGWEDAELVR